MGIVKGLFGGGLEGGGHPYLYDDAEIVSQNEEEKNFITQIQILTNDKKYEAALRALLQFMDLHPDRRRFCLFASATVLRAYGHDQGMTPVDPCILGDPRLDAIFMCCPRDNLVWVPRNQIKGGNYVSLSGKDPSKCPTCGNNGVQGRSDKLRPAEYATANLIEIKGVREHPVGSWTLGKGKRAVCAIIITKVASQEALATIKLDHADIDSQTKVAAFDGKPTTNHDLLSSLAASWYMENNTPFGQGLFASHGIAGADKLEYVILKGY